MQQRFNVIPINARTNGIGEDSFERAIMLTHRTIVSLDDTIRQL
jgi:hypothetical protein